MYMYVHRSVGLGEETGIGKCGSIFAGQYSLANVLPNILVNSNSWHTSFDPLSLNFMDQDGSQIRTHVHGILPGKLYDPHVRVDIWLANVAVHRLV
jgi:hypothetical protein